MEAVVLELSVHWVGIQVDFQRLVPGESQGVERPATRRPMTGRWRGATSPPATTSG